MSLGQLGSQLWRQRTRQPIEGNVESQAKRAAIPISVNIESRQLEALAPTAI